MGPNTHNNSFVYTICVCTYTHNLKTKGTILRSTYPMTALLSKICIYWVRDVCKMWSMSYGFKHASQPLCDTKFCTYSHNSKITGHIWTLYILNAALLSDQEMSIFCVRAGFKMQLMSYGSKHGSQSVSNKQFVRILAIKTWKLQVIYGRSSYRTTALLSETFLVCLIELHERSYQRATVPHMDHSFSDATYYAHILEACAYITIWCTTTHGNKTYLPYDCILHIKWWLYCQ